MVNASNHNPQHPQNIAFTAFGERSRLPMNLTGGQHQGKRGSEMSKPTHTPGPWHSNEPGNESVRDADEHPICIVECDYHTTDEQDANARLIAAAPDLLKQLKALVVQIKHAGLVVPPNVTAAIDKAEGR
jgi:hypothetical protein